MKHQQIEGIQSRIIQRLNNDYVEFCSYLQQEDDPLILDFVNKYIEWNEKDKVMLYQMFSKVIHVDETYIWYNLLLFVNSYLSDQNSYDLTVKWYSPVGGLKQTESKEDMYSYPVVVPTHDDKNKNKSVNEILDAMRQFEVNNRTLKLQHSLDSFTFQQRMYLAKNSSDVDICRLLMNDENQEIRDTVLQNCNSISV